MTNPTTPFNWQMPTSSDLVTDLPADFETFGQAVATSMADLLGGTTGQVLSKASNTDMDFTWVAQDDSNAIQNAIVDAKGDLIGATAADTPARLAVGANNEMLVADSSTATGLAYKSAATLYPWTSWTPGYDNITVGNGTVVAKYQQIGKTVHLRFSLVFGSTTTIAFLPGIGLPVQAAANGFSQSNVLFADSGALGYHGSVYFNSVNAVYLYAQKVNSTYNVMDGVSSTVPFTWGNLDSIFIYMTYEAA